MLKTEEEMLDAGKALLGIREEIVKVHHCTPYPAAVGWGFGFRFRRYSLVLRPTAALAAALSPVKELLAPQLHYTNFPRCALGFPKGMELNRGRLPRLSSCTMTYQ